MEKRFMSHESCQESCHESLDFPISGVLGRSGDITREKKLDVTSVLRLKLIRDSLSSE